MPKTFGSKDWCIWCKSRDTEKSREYPFREKAAGEPEILYVCSDACEDRLRDAEKLIQKGRGIFIASILLLLPLLPLGMILGMLVNRYLTSLLFIALICFGGVLVKYPMVTPQTILLLGLKRGFVAGRIAGMVLIALGVTVSVLFFLFGKHG
jgi:hypothetical protein